MNGLNRSSRYRAGSPRYGVPPLGGTAAQSCAIVELPTPSRLKAELHTLFGLLILRVGFMLGVISCIRPLTAPAATGQIIAWGGGQQNAPTSLNNVVAISTAADHSLALRSDGTVIGWGNDFDAQCTVPQGLNNAVAIAAGTFFSLALKSDGTVVAWGDNQFGQAHVPPALNNVISVSAGRAHSLALKSDGTVTAWGANAYGQCDVPPGLNNVVSVVAAWNYSIALKSDGTVVAWGENDSGQTDVPAGLSGAVAIAGNITYALALKSDGTLISWGNAPAIPLGVSGLKAIAAGEDHCLGIGFSGNVIAWGGDGSGQSDVPSGLNNASSIGAGWNYSVALVTSTTTTPAFTLSNPMWTSTGFSVSVQSQIGKSYTLEYKASLEDSTWTALQPVSGNGAAITLSDKSATLTQRFYHVRLQ